MGTYTVYKCKLLQWITFYTETHWLERRRSSIVWQQHSNIEHVQWFNFLKDREQSVIVEISLNIYLMYAGLQYKNTITLLSTMVMLSWILSGNVFHTLTRVLKVTPVLKKSWREPYHPGHSPDISNTYLHSGHFQTRRKWASFWSTKIKRWWIPPRERPHKWMRSTIQV